ncbi:hypothetical protein B4109_0911 [Geobacillus stearothermophilus]|uniref:Uncharacterized protein n=1 Tax=Geobacillus stearothermophilus TaxID=1422 RepID=A0A150MAK5_GEOSE|nr:hypothetical protein B4109_0911 [Geobacillus stearothermophilus]
MVIDDSLSNFVRSFYAPYFFNRSLYWVESLKNNGLLPAASASSICSISFFL